MKLDDMAIDLLNLIMEEFSQLVTAANSYNTGKYLSATKVINGQNLFFGIDYDESGPRVEMWSGGICFKPNACGIWDWTGGKPSGFYQDAERIVVSILDFAATFNFESPEPISNKSTS